MKSSKKKYVIIEGFRLNFNNRGNSALCYGSVFFLEKFHDLEGHILLNLHRYNKFWKLENVKHKKEVLSIQGKSYEHEIVPIHNVEYFLYTKLNIRIPFTPFGKVVKKIDYLATDFGGDGFSDIYGAKTFYGRLSETFVAMRGNIPLILLPQTLGPFNNEKLKRLSDKILSYASKIYTRDNRYEAELDKIGLKGILTNDLSSFMSPESWDVDIVDDAIGLNVSGLAYGNGWRDLKGQFENYPRLIDAIIEHFSKKRKTIYLIPHSYNVLSPEPDNDDMVACKQVYERWKGRVKIVFISDDLTAPQVKFLISRMSFFIGSRMHACYAAIFSGVPAFGLAYSYKFEGAFNNNGIVGHVDMINNLSVDEIQNVVDRIVEVYNRH